MDDVKRIEEMEEILRPNMRGGDGTVILTQILKKEELMGAGRMFSLITLEPGCSVGEHDHQLEAEIFYVIKGVVDGLDDGVPVVLHPGDLMVTGSGHRHEISNHTDKTAHILGLILNGTYEFG